MMRILIPDQNNGRVSRGRERIPLGSGISQTFGLSLSATSFPENTAQGTTIATATPTNASNPGAVSLSNIVPAGALQMNVDGATIEAGATLVNYETTTTVTVTVSYTDDAGLHNFNRAFSVSDVADGPTLTGATSTLEIELGSPIVDTPISFDANDIFVSPTGQTLTFSALSYGAMNVDGFTVEWTPDISEYNSGSGTVTFSITATDEDGQSLAASFDVDIAAILTAPYLDPTLLLVGNTIGGAYVAGSYPTWAGQTVTEATPIYTVDAATVAGSYVLQVGDLVGAAEVLLSATGSPDLTIYAEPTDVTDFSYTTPDFEYIVPAGSGGAIPDAFVIGEWSIADDGTNGDATVTVSTLPADNGSSLTNLQYRIDGGSAVALGGSTTGTYPIAGFTDTVATDVELRAVNGIGNGPWGDVKSVTTTGIPDAFVIGNWTLTDLTTGGDARIAISALPAANGSALTDLEYKKDAGSWTSLGGTSTGNYDLTGIFTDGVSANVIIRAVNGNGNGTDSDTKAVTTTTSSGWVLVGISPVIKGIVASSQQTDLTALTGGIDTVAAAGDLAVTIAGAASNTDRNLAISGQDSIIQDRATADTYRAMLVIGQKVMPGTPDTSVTITANASSGSSLCAVSYVFRNMNATNEDTLNTNTLNTFDPVMSAVTPTTAGAVALVAAVSAHNQGAVNFNLGGDVYSTASDSRNGTQDITFAVGLIDFSGGTITPAAWTITGTDNAQFSNISASVAYAPA